MRHHGIHRLSLWKGHGIPAAGMTLLEMTIVLVLMSIIAMVGLPTVTSVLQENRLGAAAQELVTALEFAQAAAMTTGLDTRVTVDVEAETILVERWMPSADLTGTDVTIPESDMESGAFQPMGHPLNRGTAYLVDLSGEDRYGGTDIVKAVFGSGNSVRFTALGVPSSEGKVALTLGDRSVIVMLHASSGKVELSE